MIPSELRSHLTRIYDDFKDKELTLSEQEVFVLLCKDGTRIVKREFTEDEYFKIILLHTHTMRERCENMLKILDNVLYFIDQAEEDMYQAKHSLQ